MKLTRPTPALERFVLVLGIASSACLAVAAFAALGSPREAGWSHLNDLVSRTRDNVRAAWNAVTADVATSKGEPVCLEPASNIVRWTRAQSAAAPARVEPIETKPITSLTVFDALFTESAHAEITRNNLTDALSLAEQALGKEADAAWIAQARLRTIQLAAKLDRNDAVRTHWEEARTAMDPRIVTGDTSTLLVCLLAALPAIDASEREKAAQPVVDSWVAGNLPVPGWPSHLELIEQSAQVRFECASDPRESAMRSLLLAEYRQPAAWAAQFASFDALRLREAVRSYVGKLPAEAGTESSTWSLHPAGTDLLAVHVDGPDAFRGHMLLRSKLDAALRAELDDRHALPDGFALDLTGDKSNLGEPVGAWMDLGPAFPRATVRHPDVASILREAESRTLWLRGGLLVLALFVAGASVATAFALRRERRLVEARTSFVAGVSHELRTPLASILLMAENLESGRAGANLERYHESIKREALRLRRLVDDVLDFSRLERGKRFEARIEDVDPAAWFDSVAAEATAMAARPGTGASQRANDAVDQAPRLSAGNRDGELTRDASPNESSTRASSFTPTVQDPVVFLSTRGKLAAQGSFDREALRRAVLNLVDNALRHSGSAEVGLHAEMSDAHTLVLRVSDRGKGIPTRQRATVFDPFTRLNGSQAIPGAGLGLAIVREIAIAHGGTVIARSPDEGPGIVLEIAVPIGSNPSPTEITT